MLVLAIEGKVLRGAWTRDNDRCTLFSARIHRVGVTVGQVPVPADTNEITQVEDLLGTVDVAAGTPVVITADAVHTQRDTATYLKDDLSQGTAGVRLCSSREGNPADAARFRVRLTSTVHEGS